MSNVTVPDRYFGFWPDDRREKVIEKLRYALDHFDVEKDAGAEAICEQVWNAMTMPNGERS